MVDKNLFLHDLSIVAILKCEGPYLKEWLDYHLLAGVDHFYLYDNESPDNQAEVAKPYVEAGLVDYFPTPGRGVQKISYNNAIKKFKFQSRYIAFIDGDEFIYPKFNKIDLHPVLGGGVIGLVDEILSLNPNAAGLAINWHCFGSNGLKKADYSRGVLERFTRRGPSNFGANRLLKIISNPRLIMDPIPSVHVFKYLNGFYSVQENGRIIKGPHNYPVTTEKIVINHYHTKSREEYQIKHQRGSNDDIKDPYPESQFKAHDCNDEFDDGILFYRDARAEVYQPPDKSHAVERLLSALEKNLSPTLQPDTPLSFYASKMETFLTCRAVADYLKTKFTNDTQAKFYEEVSLKAILKAFENSPSTADKELFTKELPELLKLPYPVVEELRKLKTD